ncbi:hypothetical protein WJX77_002751 [Trebouxia sp. C0004]
MHDDFAECFDRQPEIFIQAFCKLLSFQTEAQDQSLLDQCKVRFQELRRLSVGAGAQEEITSRMYADALGQEDVRKY